MDKDEIEHILETYFLEIHNRLNNFQRWESNIKDGLETFPNIKARSTAYLDKVKRIIEDADFIKKVFQKTQLAYRVYEKLLKKEKKKVDEQARKIQLLSKNIRDLERKVFKIEKHLNKPITEKDFSYGSWKKTPGTTGSNQNECP